MAAQVAAERLLRGAITIARQRGARMFELRAAITLGRLLSRSGKTDEARLILNEAYNQFSEGFETPEFRAADAIRKQLTPGLEFIPPKGKRLILSPKAG